MTERTLPLCSEWASFAIAAGKHTCPSPSERVRTGPIVIDELGGLVSCLDDFLSSMVIISGEAPGIDRDNQVRLGLRALFVLRDGEGDRLPHHIGEDLI